MDKLKLNILKKGVETMDNIIELVTLMLKNHEENKSSASFE